MHRALPEIRLENKEPHETGKLRFQNVRDSFQNTQLP